MPPPVFSPLASSAVAGGALDEQGGAPVRVSKSPRAQNLKSAEALFSMLEARERAGRGSFRRGAERGDR